VVGGEEMEVEEEEEEEQGVEVVEHGEEEEGEELDEAAALMLEEAAAEEAEGMEELEVVVVDMGVEEPIGGLLGMLLDELSPHHIGFWARMHRFAAVKLGKGLLVALRALWAVLVFMCPGE